MSGQSCDPVELLKNFAKETLPNYDRSSKSVHIEDKGDTWEATYYTPAEKLDVNSLTVGGEFPIVIIDKTKCKVISARFYQ
jgi:hypothetical protein